MSVLAQFPFMVEANCSFYLQLVGSTPPTAWVCGDGFLCMLGMNLHTQLWPHFHGPSSVWFESPVTQRFKALEWDILIYCVIWMYKLSCFIFVFHLKLQVAVTWFACIYWCVDILCECLCTVFCILWYFLCIVNWSSILCILLLVTDFANCAVSLSPQKASWYESS